MTMTLTFTEMEVSTYIMITVISNTVNVTVSVKPASDEHLLEHFKMENNP
uniref:Uncharacterized protein n=1 Tax=Anguilla anguilla TaxID=7936 RepID=A0A0E9RB07_ANGAN